MGKGVKEKSGRKKEKSESGRKRCIGTGTVVGWSDCTGMGIFQRCSRVRWRHWIDETFVVIVKS